MIKNDTWYKCTVCGREGRVGRCCGDETREPLNELAMEEQRSIKIDNDFKNVFSLIENGRTIKMHKDVLTDFNIWMVKNKKNMIFDLEWCKSFVKVSTKRVY